MSIFIKATEARHPKTREVKKISIILAAILVIFAVTQLFTFPHFLNIFATFPLPGGQVVAEAAGTLLIACEVFALPFILRMRLSPLARATSMILSWIVPMLWLIVSITLIVTVNTVTNVGFLGTLVSLVPGWWAVCVSIALGLLVIWTTWGLWPARSRE